jgi:hypothetical protein
MRVVTVIFMKVFGYSEAKAERLMKTVHHKGRASVWSGQRDPRGELLRATAGGGTPRFGGVHRVIRCLTRSSNAKATTSCSVAVSDFGRDFLRQHFELVRQAQADVDHTWHAAFVAPITPASDDDDEQRLDRRERAMATAAELACITVDDDVITNEEAWCWLRTLQLALRGVASEAHLFDEQSLRNSTNVRFARHVAAVFVG